MAKAMGPFRDSHAPYGFSEPRTDIPAEPPLLPPSLPPSLVGPAYTNDGPPEIVSNNQ
jgi:hypothetical protein